MLGKQGLQLQWGKERGNRDGSTLGGKTEFFGQTILDEVRQIEGGEVVDGEIVLVFYIYILGERTMEVERFGRGFTCEGGVVEREKLTGKGLQLMVKVLAARLCFVRAFCGLGSRELGNSLLFADEISPEDP